MKNLTLSRGQTSLLHHARAYHPSPVVRQRALVLLHLAAGQPVARVAAAVGVSRPTVYRVRRLWLSYGLVDLLEPAKARKVCPWRAKAPPAPTRATPAE